MFSNQILVIRVGINKMLVRMANREDPDQTASSEAVWSGSMLLTVVKTTVMEKVELPLYPSQKHLI